MFKVKYHFDNGDSFVTVVESVADAVADLGKVKESSFKLNSKGAFIDRNYGTVRCVEFLDRPGKPMYGAVVHLKRIYTISDKFMKEHELGFRYRFTALQYNSFSPRAEVIDAGYMHGMFDDVKCLRRDYI